MAETVQVNPVLDEIKLLSWEWQFCKKVCRITDYYNTLRIKIVAPSNCFYKNEQGSDHKEDPYTPEDRPSPWFQ